MALRTHYLPSELRKMQLWWSRWSDVSTVRKACELIFCFLDVAKCDLGEVDKAMIQVVEKP
jgi:hypothetical protein